MDVSSLIIGVFDKLIPADEWLAKDLQRLATCQTVNNYLWGKLVSLSPITFDDNLNTTSVSFLLQNLIYQVVNSIALHLNYCIVSFLYW